MWRQVAGLKAIDSGQRVVSGPIQLDRHLLQTLLRNTAGAKKRGGIVGQRIDWKFWTKSTHEILRITFHQVFFQGIRKEGVRKNEPIPKGSTAP